MGIEPETKDWTWVLERPCPECGQNVSQLDIAQCAQILRELAPQWRTEIAQPQVALRPNDHTWSRLEYGAHVRDALAVFGERIDLMITLDSPTFPDWDQDAAAANYGAENPAQVASEVANAIEASADLLDNLDPETHARRGLRSDGAPFTVTSLAQYFVHDVAHHLVDVRAQSAAPR